MFALLVALFVALLIAGAFASASFLGALFFAAAGAVVSAAFAVLFSAFASAVGVGALALASVSLGAASVVLSHLLGGVGVLVGSGVVIASHEAGHGEAEETGHDDVTEFHVGVFLGS